MQAHAIQQQVQQSIALLQANNVVAAANILRPLAKALPKEARILHLLATCERKMDNLKASEKLFSKALKIQPKQPEILNGYGNLLFQQDKHHQAIRQFEQALVVQPQFIDALINLGRVHNAMENGQKAKQAFAKAVQLQPNQLQAQIGLAEAERLQGNTARAIEIYQSCLGRGLVNVQICNNLAVIYREQHNISEAKRWFEQALKLNPNNFEARKNLAAACILDGEFDRAEEMFIRCLQLQPLNYQVRDQLTDLLWQQGKPHYLDHYQAAINAHPDALDLRIEYAHKLIKTEQSHLAEDLIDQVLQANPKHLGGLTLKGQFLRDRGDYTQAIQVHKKATAAAAKDDGALVELGCTYLCADQGEQALKIFAKMTKAQPHNQGWWTLHSTALRLLGRDSEYARFYDAQQFVRLLPIPLPEGYDNIEAFNAALLQELDELHNSQRHPLHQTLRHGTQTLENLFDQSLPVVDQLRGSLDKVVLDYINALTPEPHHPLLGRLSPHFDYVGSWSVRLKEQGFHTNHYHSHGWISGCYYAEVPDAVNQGGQGWIKFGEPELSLKRPMPPVYAIKPVAGYVALFPSYMWHGTYPISGSQTRVSVPFDIRPKE